MEAPTTPVLERIERNGSGGYSPLNSPLKGGELARSSSNLAYQTNLNANGIVHNYIDELDELRKLFTLKPPTETSRFWDEINWFASELEKEEKEPPFLNKLNKQLLKQRKVELQKLKLELQESKESESKDESNLLETCQWMNAHEKADKRLKSIMERVNRGECVYNRVYTHKHLLNQMEREKAALQAQVQKQQEELDQAKLKLKHHDSKTSEKDYELKQLQDQFGGIILREIKYKEKELREEFTNIEKELHKEFSINMGIQIEKKEEEIKKIFEEVDALKMKNVEWVTFQSNLSEKIYKLERDNQKLLHNNQNLVHNFTQAHNELLKTQMEMSQLKREYSELYVTHKSSMAKNHLPNDLKNLPSPQDLQKRFSDFVNNNSNNMNPTPVPNIVSPTPGGPSTSIYPNKNLSTSNGNLPKSNGISNGISNGLRPNTPQLYPSSNIKTRGSVNGTT